MKKLLRIIPVILALALMSGMQGEKKESPQVIPSDTHPTHPMFHKGMITIKVKEEVGEWVKQRGSISFNIPSLDIKASKYNVDLLEKRFIYNPKKLKRGMPDLSRIYRIEFPEEYSVLRVAEEFAGDPNIEYAEPIPVNYFLEEPNDSLYSQLHHLPQIFAPQAWEIHKGEDGDEEIVIAIVDSGVDWDHEDLIDNIWQNLGEDADGDGHVLQQTLFGEWVFDPGDENGIDDDGNGFIDDFIGWNFFLSSNDPNPIPGTFSWTHGTLMGGYASAATNNEIGVASISWNLKILPIQGGWDNVPLRSYDAIIYAAENGADIITNSWGSYGFASQAEREAINYSLELGSIILGGTANDNKFENMYPASFPGVIAVAALNHLDEKASYSNYGPHVKISAPGGDHPYYLWTTSVDNNYTSTCGTSCATPIVASLMGLVKSYHPDWSSDQVITQVLGTADDIDAINPGYENLLGAGRINAYRALTDVAEITQEIALDLYHLTFQDTDGNDILEPGDTVSLDIMLRNYNYGVGAEDATFTIVSEDPDISILNAECTGLIPADDYFMLENVFQFIVLDAGPTHYANLQLITTTDVEITWGDTIDLQVLIAPQGFLVYQDEGPGVNAYSGDSISAFLIEQGYQVFYTSHFPSSLNGFDAAFLSLGNYGHDLRQGTAVTMEMVQTIEEYLLSSGRVFVDCGSFFTIQAKYEYPNIEELKELFGISETAFQLNANNINMLFGLPGSICEDLVFTGSSQFPLWYIEIMTPNDHGIAAFEEEDYGTVAVQGEGEYAQKTFYMSYALGHLMDNEMGTWEDLLESIVDWFLVGVGEGELDGWTVGQLEVMVYPNPAQDISHFAIHISQYQYVTLKIYDLYGREVKTLVEEMRPPGEYSVRADVSDLPAGVYIIRLQAGERSTSTKLLVL
jgi:subtilisin family serine protease